MCPGSFSVIFLQLTSRLLPFTSTHTHLGTSSLFPCSHVYGLWVSVKGWGHLVTALCCLKTSHQTTYKVIPNRGWKYGSAARDSCFVRDIKLPFPGTHSHGNEVHPSTATASQHLVRLPTCIWRPTDNAPQQGLCRLWNTVLRPSLQGLQPEGSLLPPVSMSPCIPILMFFLLFHVCLLL